MRRTSECRNIVAVLLQYVLFAFCSAPAAATEPAGYLRSDPAPERFPLATRGHAAPLLVSPTDYPGVVRVAGHVRDDLAQVTGVDVELLTADTPPARSVVVAGTIGHSPLIDDLIERNRLDVTDIETLWDTFVTQTIETPWPGVDRALVIAGSNKRGTIYGLYALSREAGVSPWIWWADVPAPHRPELHVLPGRHTDGEPAVKYRGIFINDEAPALSGWAQTTFGGTNSLFYDRVYQLILRLRGNFLWPAMWGRSLWDDDPRSAPLADEYGIVLSTSHHEPLMRAHVEWSRYGEGPWDYTRNAETLRGFWREGMQRNGDLESLVTVGMRGDGDEAMTDETNIALLERIVADQRTIIEDVTGKPASQTPQVWALYKEVQDYYDHGMTVPDDVTLLYCDDNWGNIRRLPPLNAEPRSGGYGMYYHFDYVGDPRNYKWINTNPLPKVYEQMSLAYDHGVDRIWIVNVGDIKPMELPIEFFLDLAWNPDAFDPQRTADYPTVWAARTFPAAFAEDIGYLLSTYAKYNGRRKPEMLSADTYSLHHHREFERITSDYNELAVLAERIGDKLPAAYHDAYEQLVRYPVVASANLNELYYTLALNHLYAEQQRAATNVTAQRVRELFNRDAELAHHYNDIMVGGKWRHMMDQSKIGYTAWQQPDGGDTMPHVETISIPEAAAMGVAVEGSADWWPGGAAGSTATLPELTPLHETDRFIEVYNRGQRPLTVTIAPREPWLRVDDGTANTRATIHTQQRFAVSVDWDTAPEGTSRGTIVIHDTDGSIVPVTVPIRKPDAQTIESLAGFIELDGAVSIDAAHYDRAFANADAGWRLMPDLGRTDSAIAPYPTTAPRQSPREHAPHLEYDLTLLNAGNVTVHVITTPSLDTNADGGLRYAVSFNDDAPTIVNLLADSAHEAWQRMVGDHANRGTSTHTIAEPGRHTLKLWMIDPGVVVQKIIVDTGSMPETYLGPPESPRITPKPSRTTTNQARRTHTEHTMPLTATFDFFEYTGRDKVFENARPDEYTNPILAGFYPDPSITLGHDGAYYLVNSTFAYFPGIPVFRSTDLVNWTQIGSVIDRPGMLDFSAVELSHGVFAPAIEYHDGVYYVINTCVSCNGNFVVTATDPAGPWSDPVWLPEVRGIDPSIFFDDDGTAWIINNDEPIGGSTYDGHRALWMQQFDAKNLRTVGTRTMVLDGGVDPSTKPIWIEGPHIFKKDGWYYLIAAEGGTSTWHSQVALRSKNVLGPYTPGSTNPILTQRHLDPDRPNPITSAGHADFVQTPSGEWWSVFLAVRPYQGNHYNTGRETFLLPVTWENGWPIITRGDQTIPYTHKRPDLPRSAAAPIPTSGNFTVRDDFTANELAPHWLFIRTPRSNWYHLDTNTLSITARPQSIGERSQPSFIGRRQQHTHAVFTTSMRFEPRADGDRAGLVAHQRETHHFFFGLTQDNGETRIRLTQRSGADTPVDGITLADQPFDSNPNTPIELRITVDGAAYSFAYRVNDGPWETLARDVDGSILSTQSAGGFVGVVVGMYAYTPGD